MKILIVEDDDRIANPLKDDLDQQHNLVQIASDGEQALELASDSRFDLILLDIMLPIVDGYTVCRKLRESGCTSAIIMLTARNQTASKIQGLDCGADDYLAKPFELEELSAHIRAVMRRGSATKDVTIVCGDLEWDPRSLSIKYKKTQIELTPTEYRLLAHFINNPKCVHSKSDLINKLWNEYEVVGEDVIKTHIKGLRAKLIALGAPRDLLETVYGTGYRLRADA